MCIRTIQIHQEAKMKNRITTQKLNHFYLFCGILMSASELWKQWYLTFRQNNGIYQWWHFPFQLCSIAMYILLILPWLKPSRARQALLSFLMNYSLLGGIAVFADTSGLHYKSSILTVHSYLWHILLITIGLTAGFTYIKELRSPALSRQHFRDSTLLYLACCTTAVLLNQLLDSQGSINMFYINPDYKMQQIGFSALVPYTGNISAILLYILSTILGAAILFHIWRLAVHIYQQRRRPKTK